MRRPVSNPQEKSKAVNPPEIEEAERMEPSSWSKLCFFKIMFGVEIWEKMRIPLKFVKLISKDINSTATLVGPSGSSWTAIIHHDNKRGVYFKRGWQEFLRDNLIKDRHMLVFNYEGSMRFRVQVFNETGLERTNDSFPKQDEKQDPTAQKLRTKTPNIKAPEHGIRAGSASRQEETEQKEAVMRLQPKNPFFSITFKPYNMKNAVQVYVPKSFGDTHLRGIVEATVSDPSGREWPTKFRNDLKKGQWYMISAWKDFAQANQLKEMDTCVFELVQEEKPVLKVSITREGEPKWYGIRACSVPRPASRQKELEEAGILKLLPKNPFFSVKFTANYMRNGAYAYVPKNFGDSCLRGVDQATVVDHDGTEWPVKIHTNSRSGHWFMVGPWEDFTQANEVEMMDIGVFELVKAEKPVLKLSTVRKGKTG